MIQIKYLNVEVCDPLHMNATIQYGAVEPNSENLNHHQIHFLAYYMLGLMTQKSV